ncbi:MAG: shikimate dehydrogenase [Candidatus Kaiserbacteria bacterium]|nr:shikimate dehydrogenase [Candidatus Kaiserbacteria bacterium]
MDSHNQTLTCLLGDPVDHSVSDVMFQYFAQIAGVDNYNHLKFRISNTDTKNLETAMQALRVLGFAGANITLPYKESAIEYLDSIDDVAKRMGAVNTVVHKNGLLIGYNTDGTGAIKAIESQSRPICKSDKVLILGAGGAARAIIASLADKVDNITVLNRNSDIARAIKLKNDFVNLTSAIEVKPLSDENIISSLENANIVINATPVGMYPNSNSSLVNKKHIDSLTLFT